VLTGLCVNVPQVDRGQVLDAVAMSASRLWSSKFSMTVRSVPLVIRLVLMGFHSILLRR
jgi:hypothetical protein